MNYHYHTDTRLSFFIVGPENTNKGLIVICDCEHYLVLILTPYVHGCINMYCKPTIQTSTPDKENTCFISSETLSSEQQFSEFSVIHQSRWASHPFTGSSCYSIPPQPMLPPLLSAIVAITENTGDQCTIKSPARVIRSSGQGPLSPVGHRGEPEHPAEGEEELGALHYHQRAAGDLDDLIRRHTPGSVVMSPQAGWTTAKGTRIRQAL